MTGDGAGDRAPLAAVSIDLDEVPCYAAIHGLPAPEPPQAHAVYDRALPRFARWLDRHRLPATFFAIGDDLGRPEAAEALRRLHGAGHEVANHTARHPYAMTRLPRARIAAEVLDGAEAIERVTGHAPVGFRAPGYTMTSTVFEVLGDAGVLYDSSVFPCPAYYGAKALALGAYRLLGRRSRSILDDPRVLTAPADPYRPAPGGPYWRRGDGPVVELPIGVTRDDRLRLPFIGTSLVLGGRRGAAALARAVVGRPLVNLELHGIDLADAREDGLAALAAHQPDLRRTAAAKEAALDAAIEVLRDAGYRFVTLEQAAAALP